MVDTNIIPEGVDLSKMKGFQPDEPVEPTGAEPTPTPKVDDNKPAPTPEPQPTPEPTPADDDEPIDNTNDVFNTWKSKYGVEEFDTTDDINVTVQNFIDKAIEVNKKKTVDEVKEELYASNPLHQMIDEGLLQSPEAVNYAALVQEYKGLEVDELDVEQQESLVRTELELKGFEKEEIDEQIDYLKDKSKLYDRSIKSPSVISNIYTKALEDKQKFDKQANEKYEKELADFRISQKNQVEEGFYDIKLPKKDADDFFDYVTKPVTKDGQTAADVAYYKATPKQKLLIDYLLKEDFKSLKEKVTPKAASLQDLTKANNARPAFKTGKESGTDKVLSLADLKKAWGK
jgi:hypothetical protein